ncbi:hypothetical protein YPPY102_2575, partial [Yersinia pestis PY-102]
MTNRHDHLAKTGV